MLTIKWRGVSGQCGQIVRLSYERGSPLEAHTHTFPELFWIEDAPCWHRINGTREMLVPGDLVFIRARDWHQLIATGGKRFTLTNLECHPRIMQSLQQRFPEPFAQWFDVLPPMPVKVHLDNPRLVQLRRMALDYAGRSPDALHTEAFLLDLVRLLESPVQFKEPVQSCPDWLRSALLKAQEREIFTEGVAGLVRVAGRSAEHVTRSCRKYLGQTPSAILEYYRMVYAERLLRMTTDSAMEIAFACGYATTAPFYRAFRRHYNRTPQEHRRWLSEGYPKG